jgi:hypothetical protein
MTEKHYCELRVPEVDYPVLKCYEENGFFWETNKSYARKINYCPVCGQKAPKQVKEKND